MLFRQCRPVGWKGTGADVWKIVLRRMFTTCAFCTAVDALCEVSAVDTLLSNFIRPLQGGAIATVRRDPVTSQPLLDAQVQATSFLAATSASFGGMHSTCNALPMPCPRLTDQRQLLFRSFSFG